MTAPSCSGPRLAPLLLAAGIPPSLLMDLLDPEGMRLALAAELAAGDVAAAPAPAVERRARLTA